MKVHTFAVGLLAAAMAAQVVPGRVWGVDVPGPANAAETYGRAFELVTTSGAAKSLVMQEDVRKVPLDERANGLLEANKDAVGQVKKGAGETGCDWGDLPGDMQKVLDTLNRARTADSLMLLQARADLKAGRPADAVDDWLAAVAMERRVAEMKLIVASLVSDGTEVRTIDEIAKALPDLPADARRKLEDGCGRLPKGTSGEQLIMGEYAYAKRAGKEQKVAGWIDLLEPFYKTIAGAAAQPPAKFAAVVDEQMGKFKLNPFAQTVGPSFKRIREPMAVVEAKRGMLETALAIVDKGKDEATKSKDPFGDGPFTYTAQDRGFELSSGLTSKGKPVALRVGGGGS